jgi:hypothetical protein
MLGVGSRAGLMGLGVGGGATVVGFPRAALASEKMTIKESTSSGLVGDTVSYEDFTTVLMRGEAAKVREWVLEGVNRGVNDGIEGMGGLKGWRGCRFQWFN